MAIAHEPRGQILVTHRHPRQQTSVIVTAQWLHAHPLAQRLVPQRIARCAPMRLAQLRRVDPVEANLARPATGGRPHPQRVAVADVADRAPPGFCTARRSASQARGSPQQHKQETQHGRSGVGIAGGDGGTMRAARRAAGSNG